MSDMAPIEGRSFYPSIEALSAEIAQLFDRRDIDAALLCIQAFVQAVILDRRASARVFASSELDTWCQRIGAYVLARGDLRSTANDSERADCVILATEAYRTGGHTAVIEDLLGTGRLGARVVVMLTDALHQADRSVIEERFGTAAKGEISPRGGLADKLSWTITRLQALRPRRILLLNHHHDPVAIAAALPGLAEEIVFYHHADHQLCLGVTLKHTLHVDPHPMGFHNCRDALGIDENVYWPLVVGDQGWVPARDRESNPDGLRTCSSGSGNKFEYPYKYQYAELLPRVLSITGGTHFHIGQLSDDAIERIHTGLDSIGVDRSRFVYVPWVRSVWTTLRDLNIDLYIASFPLGGGRAAIEAMGAGVPIVIHDSYISPFFGGKALFYPGAFAWRHPEELFAHLFGMSREDLFRESEAARRHYDAYHTPAMLASYIDAGRLAQRVPAVTKHIGDPMQEFLDDVHYASNDHITAQQLAPIFDSKRRLAEDIVREKRVRDSCIDALQLALEAELFAMMGTDRR
ncbi:hypothetical protein [Trinickia sp. EG282A]|uniref:hypothetical protein n=1 Tax=Trinickia sp. EG282A TaxID=3237013 RepID=UPI0034D1783C